MLRRWEKVAEHEDDRPSLCQKHEQIFFSRDETAEKCGGKAHEERRKERKERRKGESKCIEAERRSSSGWRRWCWLALSFIVPAYEARKERFGGNIVRASEERFARRDDGNLIDLSITA